MPLNGTAMSLAPGAHLGPYEIVTAIGAGGMGEVYQARDTRLDRAVAIKVLSRRTQDDNDLQRRFEHEARAASALNHPNILTVFDIGSHEGAPYIVMELLEGESLRQVLDRGPLAARKLLDIAAQIADALAATGRRGVGLPGIQPGWDEALFRPSVGERVAALVGGHLDEGRAAARAPDRGARVRHGAGPGFAPRRNAPDDLCRNGARGHLDPRRGPPARLLVEATEEDVRVVGKVGYGPARVANSFGVRTVH